EALVAIAVVLQRPRRVGDLRWLARLGRRGEWRSHRLQRRRRHLPRRRGLVVSAGLGNGGQRERRRGPCARLPVIGLRGGGRRRRRRRRGAAQPPRQVDAIGRRRRRQEKGRRAGRRRGRA